MSTGVNVARRLWDQREELREAYEAVHGSDPESWPHRHPIVIDAVQFVAHATCWAASGSTSPAPRWRNSAGDACRIAVPMVEYRRGP
jgi:hypothetical protein